MIDLDEKDVKVIANARFWRKWQRRMLMTIIPPMIIYGVVWVLWMWGATEMTTQAAIIGVGGLFALAFAGALYWDIKQRRAVRKFIEEWEASKGSKDV